MQVKCIANGDAELGFLRAQERVVDFTEFEASECASGFQDAIGFLQDSGNRRAVADAEGDGIEVVCVGFKLCFGECLGVGLVE
jgi:hypothetical protein